MPWMISGHKGENKKGYIIKDDNSIAINVHKRLIFVKICIANF